MKSIHSVKGLSTIISNNGKYITSLQEYRIMAQFIKETPEELFCIPFLKHFYNYE